MSLFTLPKQVAVDSSGQPYPGALLYFYAAGGLTYQAVYTDSALSVAHSQPVVADANGVFAAIYLKPDSAADYRIQLKDADGVLLYDQDNVPKSGWPTQAQIGAIFYPETAAETAAGVTPTNYYYEPGDVRRYGAVGDDSTDCTTAIADALLQANVSSGASVYIPAGIYRISSGLSAGTSTVRIYGDGHDKSLIKATATTFDILTFAADADFIRLESFQVTRTSNSTTNDGIVFASDNHDILCISVESVGSRYGFYGKFAVSLQKYLRCRTDFCTYGWFCNGLLSGGGGAGTTLNLDNCYAANCGGLITAQYIQEVVLQNCAGDNATTHIVNLEGCATSIIHGLHSEQGTLADGTAAIYVIGSTANTVLIDGLYMTNMAAASGTCYAFRANDCGTDFRARISGMSGSSLTNVSAYYIEEGAGDAGLWYFLANDLADFGSNTASLVGGTLRNIDAETYQGVLTGSKTWDPASLADEEDTSTTVTVTGAVTGAPAVATLDSIGANASIISAQVSSSDTVTVTLRNVAGGARDYSSGTLRVKVFTA